MYGALVVFLGNTHEPTTSLCTSRACVNSMTPPLTRTPTTPFRASLCTIPMQLHPPGSVDRGHDPHLSQKWPPKNCAVFPRRTSPKRVRVREKPLQFVLQSYGPETSLQILANKTQNLCPRGKCKRDQNVADLRIRVRRPTWNACVISACACINARAV
jgi:hypothetical protein